MGIALSLLLSVFAFAEEEPSDIYRGHLSTMNSANALNVTKDSFTYKAAAGFFGLYMVGMICVVAYVGIYKPLFVNKKEIEAAKAAEAAKEGDKPADKKKD